MKKSILLILIIFLAVPILAQEEETIFNGNLESGGFGGPVLKVTQLSKTTALLVGGKGGWIINHSFVIGGGGYGLTTEILADNTYGRDLRMEVGYGGLELEYINRSNSLFHFTAGLLIGAGGVSWTENYNDWWYNDNNTSHYASDAFFIVEPAINVELNLTTWFRLNLGGSYRVVTGVDSKLNYDGYNIKTLKNSDLSGFSGVAIFKFGLF
jgi:hypothetical protein